MNAIRRLDRDCRVGVKWPNDIYSSADFKKLGGILVERVARAGERETYDLIGIGLNVNTVFKSAPLPVRKIATSLRAITSRRWDSHAVLRNILTSFFVALDTFARSGFEFFMDEWRKYDVVPHDARIAIEDGGRRMEGFYEGIHPTGELKLKDLESGRAGKIISGTLILP